MEMNLSSNAPAPVLVQAAETLTRDTPAIDIRNVSCRFISPDGKATVALRDFSMSVARGEFCAIVGPTGCGKSTTLSLITGLLKPTVGEVRIMGERVTGIDPRIGFVFQSDAVFPWRSVLHNVAAGPLFRGKPKEAAYALAEEWIRRVGLNKFSNHYPHQLSGGMRKRVALAQTFINSPEILLMDEPFSALDMQTRTLMQDELLQLWSSQSGSVVFVTHDLEEAIALADKVYVLTARPATLKSVYAIDLPRPRVMSEVRYEQRFIDISRKIWSDLREEVNIS
ncbi:ABC transporter ATP-binding protein [Glaciimonas sp. CA11.2]|uniref:ABC transporter ATP-binding protein n=2 Tax=Glaciimonas TaxID=1229970 RepID=UPI002AB3B38C|nr:MULTISPECIES: ABC transporter ATP-binding protein [unclassified Glaciimonas]MDY7544658.1 ABC transporter ATP-binding protein [Glaciimonas sp. CA11.2]MEB0012044.1 ABC transporter ATP-binding protein [Glaciimonas sp. Cout2]MEB0084295.1 ABC transporter ATP-binding protein [Glaciimonas sp. Gout2]MEB0163989.1 ABC transporter ATP-binding protein [Glaciimonas sp. CA11.2]